MCGSHTAKNGVLFHKAGESTKTRPRPLHAIWVLTLLLGSMSALAFAHLRFRPFGFGVGLILPQVAFGLGFSIVLLRDS